VTIDDNLTQKCEKMNQFSKFIYGISIILVISCGEDPILEQARSLEKEKKQTNYSSEAAEKKDSLPKIAPPKENNSVKVESKIPEIAPPDIEAPNRVQEGEPPPKPKPDEFVVFEGTISVNDWSGKPIRIDVFDGDQRNIGGKRPSVIISETVNKIGTFSIEIPQKDVMVWIGGFIDEDQDGRPGPKDPSGWYTGNPVSAKDNQKGITFSLGFPDAPPSK
jgi:hypothetical protein